MLILLVSTLIINQQFWLYFLGYIINISKNTANCRAVVMEKERKGENDGGKGTWWNFFDDYGHRGVAGRDLVGPRQQLFHVQGVRTEVRRNET